MAETPESHNLYLMKSLAISALMLLTLRLSAQTELTVAQDGSGQFKSVQAAIMSVPSGSRDNPVIIHIKPGTYKELIYIQREKGFFKLMGENPTNTVGSPNLMVISTAFDPRILQAAVRLKW